jgi:probable F420-dependent oxidoreductase
MQMKFWLSLMFEPPHSLATHARNAEAHGFEGVVLPDHVIVKEGPRTPHPNGYPLQADEIFLDPLLAFSAMAAVTTRLKFLTFVFVVPLRDPFTLAKQAGSLAVLSDNRFILGTGTGWLKEEFETLGRDFHTRGRRMDETLSILRDLWDDGYAEFHGQHFDFPRSGMFPVPDQHIPIWIGGHSKAAARRAAKHDGYLPMRVLSDPGGVDSDTLAEFAFIDEHRRAQGLPSDYDRLMTVDPSIVDRSTVRRFEEAGITNLLVQPWQTADQRLSQEDKSRLVAEFAESVIA